MFQNPEIKAVFAARGGFGSARILELLNFDLIRKNPKIFSGFSDTTALQLGFCAQTSMITYSGISLCVNCHETGMDTQTEHSLWGLLCEGYFREINNLKVMKPGIARGTLIGGCLSVVVSLVGTPYLPDMKDVILIIEDVNEEPYRIDRMLTQLRLSGILGKISGLIFGQFESCRPELDDHGDLQPIFRMVSEHVQGPVIAGLPYGHGRGNIVIPLGAQARITAEENVGNFAIEDQKFRTSSS